MKENLNPIQEQIKKWIESEGRSDEMFSLWRPLRFTLARINGYPKLNKIGNLDNKKEFLKALSQYNLEDFLPVEKEVVRKLARFFELGTTPANKIEFPSEKATEAMKYLRNQEPNYDYMPYFLYECFEGGRFATCYESDASLQEWIKEQHLEMLFEGQELKKEKIKDLSGMGDYRKSIPLDMEFMLDNYIKILEKRQEY